MLIVIFFFYPKNCFKKLFKEKQPKNELSIKKEKAENQTQIKIQIHSFSLGLGFQIPIIVLPSES